eukprot:CAMPEP_0119570194 /NCGR_PEP_ID=MMETSP1352-20130426/43489_1 /TAXON_ID=265584 /ORGANISM="Stauroneis constricta, Strain CCMP1120" /LENGTH=690 /DNA_ID=CAMNT_0007619861 /DNA_START=181 /DNA_END=2253 /DNA_ORIENTATION=-
MTEVASTRIEMTVSQRQDHIECTNDHIESAPPMALIATTQALTSAAGPAQAAALPSAAATVVSEPPVPVGNDTKSIAGAPPKSPGSGENTNGSRCVDDGGTVAGTNADDTVGSSKKANPYRGLVFEAFLSPDVLEGMDRVYQNLPQLPPSANGNESQAQQCKLLSWEELDIHSVLGQGGFAYVLQVTINEVGGLNPKQPNNLGSSQRHANRACKCIKAKNITTGNELVAAAQDLYLEAHWLRQLRHDNIIALIGVCAEAAENTGDENDNDKHKSDANQNAPSQPTSSRSIARLSASYVHASGNGFFVVLPELERTLLDQFQLWKQQEQGFNYDDSYYSEGAAPMQKLEIYDAYNDAHNEAMSSLSSISSHEDNGSSRSSRSWKKFPSMLSGMSLSSTTSLHSKHSVHQRLRTIAVPMLKAMEYLHEEKKLVYRDLKPENIGFLERQHRKLHVQLLDFGLARTVDQLHALPEPEVAGSWRYMAPELIRQDDRDDWIGLMRNHGGMASEDDERMISQFYYACDVYSFAIVLWELITLCVPFRAYTKHEQFEEAVGIRRERPSVSLIGSKKLQMLLQDCWNENPYRRPSFTTVLRRMESEILKLKRRAPSSRKKRPAKAEQSTSKLPEHSKAHGHGRGRKASSSASSSSQQSHSGRRFLMPRFRSSEKFGVSNSSKSAVDSDADINSTMEEEQ